MHEILTGNCEGICKQCNSQVSEIPDGSHKKTSYLHGCIKSLVFVETHFEQFYWCKIPRSRHTLCVCEMLSVIKQGIKVAK